MTFFQLLLKLSSVSVLTSAIVLVTSMMLGRIMEPQHFGEYSFLQSVLMILVNASSMAASLAISVFMYRSPQTKINRILNNALFTVLPAFLVIGFIVIVVICIIKSTFEATLFLIMINSVMMSVCLMGIDYLRMRQILRSYSVLYVWYTSSVAFFSVLGYLVVNDVFYVYFSSAFALIFPLIYTIQMFSKYFEISFNFNKKIKTYIWSVKYGAPVVASTVIMSFLVVGDKLLLGFFVSKTELAKYSIAALVASTTLFLVNNFASAWGSFLFKKLPNLNGVDFKIYYFTTMKKLVICIPIMLVAYSFQYFLYMFFFEQKYPKLSVEIFILTASYSLLGVSKFFMGFLNYFGRNELILYTALFSTVFMVLFSVFIFELSALSMAVSVFVSMFVLCVVISCLTTREVNKYAVK